MNMSTKVQHRLSLIVLSCAFVVGMALAVFGDASSSASVTDISVAHANISESIIGVASTNEEEPEDTLGPAIAIGMLGVGFVLGAFTIHKCHKESADSAPSQ